MPRVRRANLPPALYQHLLDRVRLRSIPADQLGLLGAWLSKEPIVPDGSLVQTFSRNDGLWERRVGEDFPQRGSIASW